MILIIVWIIHVLHSPASSEESSHMHRSSDSTVESLQQILHNSPLKICFEFVGKAKVGEMSHLPQCHVTCASKIRIRV